MLRQPGDPWCASSSLDYRSGRTLSDVEGFGNLAIPKDPWLSDPGLLRPPTCSGGSADVFVAEVWRFEEL